MGRKAYKEGSENFFSSIFGFIWDCLKIVFKFPPDPEQSFFEFIMEKLGALAVMLVCIGFLALLIFGIIMDN